MKQEQFLEVLDRDLAESRWHAAISLSACGIERVPLDIALGRILAKDLTTPINVPGFDRSNMDGFAIRAEDSFGASEEAPKRLTLTGEQIQTAVVPKREVGAGEASPIATGGMLPRGADAVIPVEATDLVEESQVEIHRSVTPGNAISYAATDIGLGETLLFRGSRITSRESGVLAAVGHAVIPVFRQPRIAIISTGDEIVAPESELQVGQVYDSNGRILCDAVRELGAVAKHWGIVKDDQAALESLLQQGC